MQLINSLVTHPQNCRGGAVTRGWYGSLKKRLKVVVRLHDQVHRSSGNVPVPRRT